MKAILPRIRPEWCDQILVVDGGSRDGTLEFAKAQGLETYVQRHKGIRFVYIEAWPLIRGDVVITFSPDGNCPPEAIPLLRESMTDGYDMVIASRYLREARSEDDDLLTGFGNWMFTRLINIVHGGRYIEPLLSIRCAKKRLHVAEIPVPEPLRIGGKRKLQMFRWGGAYLLQIVREIYHWR